MPPRFIVKVSNLKTIAYPLESYLDETDFRIYPTDIGMMIAAYGKEMKTALLKDGKLEDLPESLLLHTSKGGLYEALAADIIYKQGYSPICFYAPKGREMKIEFVLEGMDGIVPVEIKAGRSRSRSLDTLLAEYPQLTGIKAGSYNIGSSGKKLIIPLYALPFLRECSVQGGLQIPEKLDVSG